MTQTNPLFFIALLPPEELQAELTAIKDYFAHQYASRHALKSPPHITLQPPFSWPLEHLERLEQSLESFAQDHSPIFVTLSGFGAFSPRVIYAKPLPSPELLLIHRHLQGHLHTTLNLGEPSPPHPFSPHITVAFRDLTREHFHTAWAEFSGRSFNRTFWASHITLLRHNGHHWTIQTEYSLSKSTDR